MLFRSIVSELPKSELAVVVLIVRAIFGSRVSDTFDDSESPPGSDKGIAFGYRDGVVYEHE